METPNAKLKNNEWYVMLTQDARETDDNAVCSAPLFSWREIETIFESAPLNALWEAIKSLRYTFTL